MTYTILGAGGQIADGVAKELSRLGVEKIRLVSRNPKAVLGGEELVSADLTDAEETRRAVAGSEVVFFTAGLPPQTELWESKFPVMLRHSLDAALAAGAKFAYFDNTYMYPQDDRVQDESTPFEPVGRKGQVRAEMARMVLHEMERGEIPVLIGRAPEFYGSGRTQSFTNSLVIDRLASGKRAFVPVRSDRKRSLIWTPDASRALALLGVTPDAFGRTWHLPVDHAYPTYQELISTAARTFGVAGKFTVLPQWLMRAVGRVVPAVGEMGELLPRYAHDNVFDDSAFRERFPDFEVTSFSEGLELIAAERGE